MKKLFVLFLLLIPGLLLSQDPFAYAYYLDPLPNAKHINKTSAFIIRPKENISINTIQDSGAVIITGSLSGRKTYTSQKADDNKIVIIKPSLPFIAGETVTLKYTSVVKKKDGTSITPFQYSFSVSDPVLTAVKDYSEFWGNEFDVKPSFFGYGVPQITVTYSHFPSPGKLFFNNLVRGNEPNTPVLLIVDNNGKLEFAKEMPKPCYDLNMQPNGMLTYFDGQTDKYYGMNESYNIVDSFQCGNGYITDLHELKILPNGNFLVMSYDTRNVDSIPSVHLPAASRVIGVILQEIDVNRNVIFQWRSWDYFLITDATHENLSAPLVDYCHSNAIDVDNDGNWLLSSRNMDEITKIDRLTGSVIWRWGGKNNQFTFINDPYGFSHQHAIRRIKNGNVTLFDNGNYHEPPFSRAVEYKLDEVNKTATLVWQYRNNPDIYAPATGYVQRLPNNNTLICWGLTNPTLAEVRYDGTKVLEMTLPQGVFSYRAYRYEWKENANSEILPAKYNLVQNFPNPFNPSTTIKFAVQQQPSENSLAPVTLAVYDINGRLVKVLVNESFPAGTYSVNYDGSGTASGIYFYRINIGSFSDTKKMVLIK